MNEPTKRPWIKPELIVIVRGGPEESILSTCKVTGSGPTGTNCVNSSSPCPSQQSS